MRSRGTSTRNPWYWRPPAADHGLIIAATENDLVYALDAATGRVAWRTVLGQPVAGAALPCGNIAPLGITGTPVIDADRGAVYLDAMIDDHGAPRHRIYGLRLADGSVLSGFPIDVAAGLAAHGIRFNPKVQNQRGALALLHDRIFVPFGGHYGDCGDYHGVVVAVGIDPPALLSGWATRASKGGIWAPAGISELVDRCISPPATPRMRKAGRTARAYSGSAPTLRAAAIHGITSHPPIGGNWTKMTSISVV